MLKKNRLVGCCGIACGLCPRFQSKSKSRCLGCGFNQHCNYCPLFNCCIKKRKYLTCADCPDFPCEKFSKWSNPLRFKGYGAWFTFSDNIQKIRSCGLKKFIEEEKKRQRILETLLEKYNPGGLINFYCKVVSLLSISSLKNALKVIKTVGEKNPKTYKDFFLRTAKEEQIDLNK